MTYKAVKVMLIPNNWQKTRLFQYAGTARFAYNWALAKEMESLRNGNGLISDHDLRKEFTQLKKQEDYRWLNDVSNDVPKQAIKDLVNAYLRYFKERKKPGYKPYTKKQIAHAKRIGKILTEYDRQKHPKFKNKKNVNHSKFYNDTHKLEFTEKAVRISALYKRGNRKRQARKSFIKMAERNRIPISGVKYNNPRVSYDGLNWWISVALESGSRLEQAYVAESDGLGIDVGVKDLAILNDGTKFPNINKTKLIKKCEKKKRRIQRSISRKYEINKKGKSYHKTGNIIKSEKTLLTLTKRLTNIRHEHRNRTILEIINRKPKFMCLEDLNVSGMLKNKYLSKAVQDQGLREFRNLMEYHAKDRSIPLILADRWYPSTKRCSCCGCIKTDLKLKDRIYKCNECGHIEDRDVNSGKNLYAYGKLALADF